ncbi:MAG: glycosyltransferase family 39 protein [Planctomycetota bacterium]|nr:glycosyltransferase family 39 protein [Planctomycetota bacterium]
MRKTTSLVVIIVVAAISLAFAALAMIDTELLARFFTHKYLASRAGVEVRSVTQQGAELFRVMCVLSAFVWAFTVWILVRSARKNWHTPQSTSSASLDFLHKTPATARLRFALFCAISVGMIERLWRISESFWYDEISALIDYAQYGPGAIIGTYFVQSNHVLHTLLSSFAVSIAGGSSEPILRMPAFLAGIASIAAIVGLARETALWQGVPTRARMSLACGVAALAPIMVLESVEARGYSMMILFAALASWIFLRALRIGSPLSWVVYAILCALGIWSHLVFVVLPISHGVIAAWLIIRPRLGSNDRKRGREAILAITLAGITTVTFLSPLLPDLLRIRREFQALDGNEPSIFSLEGIHVLLGIGGAWTPLAALPGIGLFFIGVFGARRDITRRMPLAATLIGLPILVIATELGGSWMYARFALFALPGILIAITLGAFDVARFLRQRDANALRVNRALILGAIAIAALWSESLGSLPPKQPIRDAVVFVRNQDPSLTSIVSVGLPSNVVAYYGILADLDVRAAGLGGVAIDQIPTEIEWMIVLYPQSLVVDAKQILLENWTLVETFSGWVDWKNGDVLVYRRNSSAKHPKN